MASHYGKFVSYVRVSTGRQGESGLGLDAQRRAVDDFLNGGDWELVAEFEEIESGKNNDRPELVKALAAARAYNATLLIAKLDRLSRNAAFLLALRDAGVKFIAVDMPEANELTIGLMALIAEHERRAISERTASAMATIKRELAENGHYTTLAGRVITKLGNGGCHLTEEARAAGTAGSVRVRQTKALQKARDLQPIINRLRNEGITSATGLSKALNAEGVPTASGRGQWSATSVQRVLVKAGQPAR